MVFAGHSDSLETVSLLPAFPLKARGLLPKKSVGRSSYFPPIVRAATPYLNTSLTIRRQGGNRAQEFPKGAVPRCQLATPA